MLKSLLDVTYRQARRLVILLVGGSVLLLGILLIFTPGPAIVVIPAGLGILSIEFAWARSFLKRVRREISDRHRGMRLKRNGAGDGAAGGGG